jgi:predicted nucleotidyltransferase
MNSDPMTPMWLKDYSTLAKAYSDSFNRKKRLSEILSSERFISNDASVVVFGSLARNEWTSGSDLDWTLMIDGQADPEHRRIAHEIATRLEEEGFSKPGPTGVFGSLSFSHDIIHWIGGEDDTHHNMAQRILLLLESYPLAQPLAYNRIVRGVLDRYVEDETTVLAKAGHQFKIPRFLLNDMARFWRTMAVDYVAKRWERGGKGWALRNAKLRMSRKLIFSAGLCTCFSCGLSKTAGDSLVGDSSDMQNLTLHLLKYVSETPLSILVNIMQAHQVAPVGILRPYEDFLTIIDDQSKREHLEHLASGEANEDGLFNDIRTISHAFHDGLNQLFFGVPEIRELTEKYGMF